VADSQPPVTGRQLETPKGAHPQCRPHASAEISRPLGEILRVVAAVAAAAVTTMKMRIMRRVRKRKTKMKKRRK
jgi:hypothetical protein